MLCHSKFRWVWQTLEYCWESVLDKQKAPGLGELSPSELTQCHFVLARLCEQSMGFTRTEKNKLQAPHSWMGCILVIKMFNYHLSLSALCYPAVTLTTLLTHQLLAQELDCTSFYQPITVLKSSVLSMSHKVLWNLALDFLFSFCMVYLFSPFHFQLFYAFQLLTCYL